MEKSSLNHEAIVKVKVRVAESVMTTPRHTVHPQTPRVDEDQHWLYQINVSRSLLLENSSFPGVGLRKLFSIVISYPRK